MQTYAFSHQTVTVFDNGQFALGEGFVPHAPDMLPGKFPNFEINIDGDGRMCLRDGEFRFDGARRTEDALTLRYTAGCGLAVEVRLCEVAGVLTETHTVTNTGTVPRRLTRFSSSYLDRIGDAVTGGDATPWFEKDLRVWICHNKWTAEGQWRSYTPDELGIYPATTHDCERESYRISSLGNWSTANFQPVMLVEDTSAWRVWFMEIGGAQNWQIKLAAYTGYLHPTLSMEATACDETLGGWFVELLPGESYTAPQAVIGTVAGGFEQAAAALVAFHRADATVSCEVPPLVFNDYMDCVWATQDPALLHPLIDRAADVGCECFMIDGGWCTNAGHAPAGTWHVGDWLLRPELYGKDGAGMKELADHILARGMTPGIWFEFDACEYSVRLLREDPDSVIRRYDRPVGKAGRYFYNFRNENVRAFLKDCVRKFYDMGFRYIKNDFNQSAGIGCTYDDVPSAAEGLRQNTGAFYDFVEELYRTFPGLVIENCGSGALRADHGTLRHFHLQSTSDQEFYQKNPSILMGSCALIPPEKAGIWAYPYPVRFEDEGTFVPDEAYFARMADGRQTVFNLVSGLSGVLYLSGRIDLADEKNTALIRQAAEIFRQNRHHLPVSRPVYPTGMHPMNARQIASFGLLDGAHMTLAVWNTDTAEHTATIPLGNYLPAGFSVVRTFCHREIPVEIQGATLRLTLEGESAVWLELQGDK